MDDELQQQKDFTTTSKARYYKKAQSKYVQKVQSKSRKQTKIKEAD